MKRIAALLSALILTLTLVGCGPSNNNSGSNQSPSPTEQAKPITSIPQATPTSQVTPTVTVKPTTTPTPTSPTVSVTGQLKVHYIDVGQADSILIQNGSNAMLIDAGNNSDSNTVVNYIKNQGISKLDYVVGTHPHEDHIGGMDVVINSFSIGTVYMPKVTSETTIFKDVITAITKKGLKITTPVPGSTFKVGDAVCTILAPNSSSYNDTNDYSIVIKLNYGNTSFLMMGDASAVSEMEMVKKGYDLKADVLKVGHHGSKTSSSANFLSAVNPKYAVISVGKGNDYGHPEASTMDRLQGMGILVFRTDEAGAIICTTDGKNISFNSNPGTYGAGSGGGGSGNQSDSGGTNTVIVSPVSSESEGNVTENKEVTVFVTSTGSKYHSDGCRYLSKSKMPMSLSDARKSYGSCSVCNPPR